MKLPFTKDVKRVIRAAYPDYNGRKITLLVFPEGKELRSYWDEGNKTYYTFVNVDTLATQKVEENHPFFQAFRPAHLQMLPSGIVCVALNVYGASTNTINIYVRPDEMPKFLPVAPTGGI